MTNQTILLPDPATQIGKRSGGAGKIRKERTFAVNPQEGTVRHPISEYAGFEQPRGRHVMMNLASRVVVCRRVGWRYPFSNFLFYLLPCDQVSVFAMQAVVMADTNILCHLNSSNGHNGFRHGFSIKWVTGCSPAAFIIWAMTI